MKSSISISLCMIVKDEERVISRCLDSVKHIVDEIIIVDTGSTDKTKEIVAKYTQHIYNLPWQDNFAEARNYSFSLANKDYILWLDADDVIPEDDGNKLLKLKKTLSPSIDSVTMNYNLQYNKDGKVLSSLKRNRLVKRSKNFRWVGHVHEYLEVYGEIFHSDINIEHRKEASAVSYRNLKIYEKMLNSGIQFTPRDTLYYANELHDHQRYDEAAECYRRFLKDNKGWYEDNIHTCGRLADHYGRINNDEEKLRYIFKSFEYDSPRADFCCRLGYHFLARNKYTQAIFWYELATQLQPPKNVLGLVNHACWTWLPHVQLCICYYRIGKLELAKKHNDIAEGLAPDSPYVQYNKKFFNSK